MFYILSRFLACTASPVLYIVALLVVAVWVRRAFVKRLCFWSAVFLLLIFTNTYLYNIAEKAWVSDYIFEVDTTKRYDYAILPGGFTAMDKERERVEYGEAGDRMVDCAVLYNIGIVDKIIISGDGVTCETGKPERFMRHVGEAYGIDSTDVILEREAKNTMENFTKTISLMGDSLEGKRILVINSGVYMRRTVLCCDMVGLECDYYTVDFVSQYPITWETFVPNFNILDKWMKLIHEWIGCVAYSVNY